MKPKNKEYLLRLARRTIEKFLTNKEIIVLDEDDLDSELKEHKGVFVTLKKNDELIKILKKAFFLQKNNDSIREFFEIYKSYNISDLFLKDIRCGKEFRADLPIQAINDLIITLLHSKIIIISNKNVILTIKSVNSSFDEINYIPEQYNEEFVYLEKYLQKYQIYENSTLNFFKTLVNFMYADFDFIKHYLTDYENYPILNPNILFHLIEIVKQLEITNKDFYVLKRELTVNIEKNKKAYFYYKVLNQNIKAESYEDVITYFPKKSEFDEIPDN